jgi:hypothetical protein
MLSVMFVKQDAELYLTKDVMGHDTLSIYVFGKERETHNTVSLKFFSKEDLLLFIDKINTLAKGSDEYEHVTASE